MLRKSLEQAELIEKVYINDSECLICTEMVGTTVGDGMSGIGVLICGHVFCLKCITDYQGFCASVPNSAFKCPTCNKPQQRIFNLEQCSPDIQKRINSVIFQARVEQQTISANTKQCQPQSPVFMPMSSSHSYTAAAVYPRQSSFASSQTGFVPPPVGFIPQQRDFVPHFVPPQMDREVRENKLHPFWVHRDCERCRLPFGWIGMRYHCRVCNRVICPSCSRNHPLHRIVKHGISNRVCLDCFV